MRFPERLQNFHWTRRRIAWLIALLIMLGGVGLLVYVLNAPVHGKQVAVDMSIHKNLQQHQEQAPPTPAQDVGSSYFSLHLPPGYTVQQQSGVSSGLLYSQTILKTSTDGTLIIAIGIKNAPDGGLSGDTSYALRSSRPETYQISQEHYGGQTVSVATDQVNGGVVAFWLHGAYLATLSVSSGLSNGSGQTAVQLQALNGLLAAWQWH